MMESIPSGTILHGRYRIERMLGTGGFGHVYLAVDVNTNQQYALKEFFVSGSGGQAHLQHEASVLSELHHPNLPAFREAFNERGHYFVVLSYIEGSDLTELLRIARQRNEAIPTARILAWILSICDAVAFLHNHRPPLIHRDIKPDNIRIMPNGTAVLVDLGNAKAAANGERTLFFIRHQGTPGYAPQEQYPGGSGTDARSDIYALGGTLYFALTAHEPPNVSVRTQSIQQRMPDLPSLQELLAQNPPEEADAPGNRQYRGSPRQGRPWYRHSRHLAQLGMLSPMQLEQLNRIITRAMAMNPRDRYQTVADLTLDLKKALAAMPSSTIPSTPPPRSLDPNSTQPDLPQLFEAYEEAKLNATPSEAPGRSQPPSQATATCPRCGATILASATFCSHCGSDLRSQPRPHSPANAVEGQGGGTSPPSPRAATSPRQVDLEQTMIIRPQGQAAIQVKPPDTPPATSPAAQDIQMYRNVVQREHSVITQQHSSGRGDASKRSVWPALIIGMAIIVIALLILMIVLLLGQGHTAALFWRSAGVEVVMYGKSNVFGITASSAASFTAGLWACGAVFSSSAGLS